MSVKSIIIVKKDNKESRLKKPGDQDQDNRSATG